jgi:hypothetical protein
LNTTKEDRSAQKAVTEFFDHLEDNSFIYVDLIYFDGIDRRYHVAQAYRLYWAPDRISLAQIFVTVLRVQLVYQGMTKALATPDNPLFVLISTLQGTVTYPCRPAACDYVTGQLSRRAKSRTATPCVKHFSSPFNLMQSHL